MSNRFRGEADLIFMRTIEPGGPEKEARFKLVYDANAFCEIEDALDLKLGAMHDIMTRPENLSMKMLRGLLHGGLLRHHPELTERDAGDIMSDAGIAEVMEAMKRAFGGALKEAGEPEKGKRPSRVKSGTGTER